MYKWLEPLLFAMWEVPQASTGFSQFELLYGRNPCEVLDVIREACEEGPSNSCSKTEFILEIQYVQCAKLHTLGWLSMENLLQVQNTKSQLYNRGMRQHQLLVLTDVAGT